jgi:hypothetical protein
MNIEEIWVSIKGYENYKVSNYGNVCSIDRCVIDVDGITRRYKSKFLKPIKNTYGYNQVALYINGNKKTITIHRLVVEAFIPNIENKPEINHKDGIKTNNIVFNLEWATSKENIQHAFRTGLLKSKVGIEHPNSKPVIQLDKIGNVLNRFICAREADLKTTINYKSISKCCLGIIMSAGGYVWKFDTQIVT